MSETRPLIGIPAHRQPAGEGGPEATFVLRQLHVRAVSGAGGAPVLVPTPVDEAVLETIYRRLDGLLLPGGGDLDPAQYGQTRRAKLLGPDDDLDRVELALARWALRDDLPVLAICRGIQVLNVAAGGTLIQDIRSDRPGALAHESGPVLDWDLIAHEVSITPGTRLAGLVGGEPLAVNSRHHQAVDRVAEGFVVCAAASDGMVEAMEHPGRRFALGVQFHPEDLFETQPRLAALFAGFVAACR